MPPAVKYGFIAAGGMSAWTLAEYGLGLHTTHLSLGQYTSWGTKLIFIVTLWCLLRQQLHRSGRSRLPVWDGLLHGAITSVVAATGFYLLLSLYLNIIHPDYAHNYLEWLIGRMRAAGTSEGEIRQAAKAFLWRTGPTGLPVTVFRIWLLLGAIASPLLTLWLNWRRK